MAKRYPSKEIEMAELFAEEMGIDFNAYTVAKILDMGIEKIKSPKNHEIEEWIDNIKSVYKKLQVEMKPYIEKALEDKPVLDVAIELQKKLDGNPNFDLQEFAKEYGNKLNETRTKAKTKNPTAGADGVSFNQRNKIIKALNLYNKLKQTRKPYSALNKVANKYGWKISTCKKNLTKARKLQK